MQQTAIPVPEQLREVVEAVVEVLREPKPEEDSPLVATNSFEAQRLRAEIIRVGRKLWERQYAVSYTHLDVYKRQFPRCPRWPPSAGSTAWA